MHTYLVRLPHSLPVLTSTSQLSARRRGAINHWSAGELLPSREQQWASNHSVEKSNNCWDSTGASRGPKRRDSDRSRTRDSFKTENKSNTAVKNETIAQPKNGRGKFGRPFQATLTARKINILLLYAGLVRAVHMSIPDPPYITLGG